MKSTYTDIILFPQCTSLKLIQDKGLIICIQKYILEAYNIYFADYLVELGPVHRVVKQYLQVNWS